MDICRPYNSVITRKGRAIADKLGLTPERLVKVIQISLEIGNTDGANQAALKETVRFLEEEIKEDCGVDVKIPYDIVGADYFFVPPSGDLLVNPEAVMGIAKVFHKLGASWTLSSKAFDGANYGLFTGDDKSMKEDNKLYIEEAKRLKCKTMMMGECGHAHRIMKFIMEKAGWWGSLPFEITNVLQYTAGMVQDGAIKFDKSGNPKSSKKNADSETALMQGDYKLIKTWKKGSQHTVELYNIAEDPGEARDLANSKPELTASLGKMLDEYIAQSGGDVTIDTD